MLYVNIKKKLGSFLLDVNFETDSSTLALLGASGCGKSVTLRCIAGILKPDEGRIVLNGRTLFDSEKKIDLPPQKRRIGYLFQEYALFPNMTVEQNILTAVHGKAKGRQEQILDEVMDKYKIRSIAHLKPAQLSGGQKQRTALARIMAQNPEVLLLDEPFSALDSYLKFQLELDLLDTLRNFSGDVIFVSHSRNEVSTICSEVCVINQGASEPKENVQELLKHPQSVNAALLSRCANFTPVRRLENGCYYSDEWNLHLLSTYENAYPITHAGIRAVNVKPMSEIDPDSVPSITEQDAPNLIICIIQRIIEDPKGDICMLLPAAYETSIPAEHFLRMDCSKVHLAGRYSPGDKIVVSIDPKHIMLLADKIR